MMHVQAVNPQKNTQQMAACRSACCALCPDCTRKHLCHKMGLVAALRFPDGQVISQGARAQALVGCYDMNAQRQPPEHTALPASLPCIKDGVQVDRSRQE